MPPGKGQGARRVGEAVKADMRARHLVAAGILPEEPDQCRRQETTKTSDGIDQRDTARGGFIAKEGGWNAPERTEGGMNADHANAQCKQH